MDARDGITKEHARELIRACALAPDAGPERILSIAVQRRDYARSAAIVAMALVLALLAMLRRRVVVTLDAGTGTLEIVERGFVFARNRHTVSAYDVERATVTIGPCGPLNGTRVELVLRAGTVVPLTSSFVLAAARAHARAARAIAAMVARAALEEDAPAPGRTRRRWLLAIALACAALAGGAVMFGRHRLAHAAKPGVARVDSPSQLQRTGDVRDGSTIVLGTLSGRKLAFIADEEEQAVRAVERTSPDSPLGEANDAAIVKLGTAPGAMVMDRRGRVFVTLPRENAIAVVQVERAGEPGAAFTMRETARIATESEPVAVSLTPNEDLLVVASSYGHSLEAFRTEGFARVIDVELPRSPRSLAISKDGLDAVVSHDSISQLSVVHLAPGTQHSISLDADAPFGVSFLLGRGFRGAERAKGPSSPMLHAHIARAGDKLMVAGTIVTTGDPAVPIGNAYYAFQFVEAARIEEVSLDDRRARAYPYDLLSEQEDRFARASSLGCLLPRAVASDAAGEWLYVACEGPGRVFKVAVGGKKRCVEDGAWGAAFRVADGPTGIAVDEERRSILVWSQTAQAITAIPFDGGLREKARWDGSMPRPDIVHTPWRQWTKGLRPTSRDAHAQLVARGRTIFFSTNDTRITSGGPACASCHIEGKDDGLLWPTSSGERRTPMLAGRVVGTAPFGWNGDRPTISAHLVDTFERLGGTGLEDSDRDALVAYVESLPGPRFSAKHVDAVARGERIFFSPATGCSNCHSGDKLTDGERHELGAHERKHKVETREVDTPSLLFVGESAPYFHDGRYKTLTELLDKDNDTMGHTSQLSAAERRDLVRYLESIGSIASR
jgi:hypothetical protein